MSLFTREDALKRHPLQVIFVSLPTGTQMPKYYAAREVVERRRNQLRVWVENSTFLITITDVNTFNMQLRFLQAVFALFYKLIV